MPNKKPDILEGLTTEDPKEPPESIFDIYKDAIAGPFTVGGSDKVYYIKDDKIVDENGEPMKLEEQQKVLARYVAEGMIDVLGEASDGTAKGEELKIIIDAIREDIMKDTRKAALIMQRVDIAGPALLEELKKAKYKGENLETLLYSRTMGDLVDDEDPKTILLLKALDAVEKGQQLIRRPEVIATPLDKVTTDLFKLSLPDNKHKAKLDINTTAHKDNAPVTHVNAILYFDDDITKKFSLTKELNAFDKLTASAVYSIWRDNHDAAGHCITTLNAIHNSTNKSNATQTQIERIHNSLIKQSLTRVYIDNRQEAEAYDYERFNRGNTALLEMREVDEITTRNGKITDGYIEILAEPPALAFSFAHGRQVADIPAAVFKSGIPQKENNLAIQDYLIRRIAPERNKLRKLKDAQQAKYTLDRQKKINKARETDIQVKTLLENTGRGGDSKDKARAIDTAMKYLNHFADVGWIESAKLSRDKTKITIRLIYNDK